MGVRVVLTKDVLKRNRACSAAYTSPEWSDAENALVYADFDRSVDRLMATKEGTNHLRWLVANKLVPMTKAEFETLKARQ